MRDGRAGVDHPRQAHTNYTIGFSSGIFRVMHTDIEELRLAFKKRVWLSRVRGTSIDAELSWLGSWRFPVFLLSLSKSASRALSCGSWDLSFNAGRGGGGSGLRCRIFPFLTTSIAVGWLSARKSNRNDGEGVRDVHGVRCQLVRLKTASGGDAVALEAQLLTVSSDSIELTLADVDRKEEFALGEFFTIRIPYPLGLKSFVKEGAILKLDSLEISQGAKVPSKLISVKMQLTAPKSAVA